MVSTVSPSRRHAQCLLLRRLGGTPLPAPHLRGLERLGCGFLSGHLAPAPYTGIRRALFGLYFLCACHFNMNIKTQLVQPSHGCALLASAQLTGFMVACPSRAGSAPWDERKKQQGQGGLADL